MSATYTINGYIDIRIKLIDKEIYASQSTTPEELIELIKIQLDCKLGACEIVGHKIMLGSIG
jgi:hypothetical protein